jgi:hypothetical protein
MYGTDLKNGDYIEFTHDASWDDLDIPVGYRATVVGQYNPDEGTIPLNFDNNIERERGHGHDLDGRGTPGHGWNFGVEELDDNFKLVSDSSVLDWPE